MSYNFRQGLVRDKKLPFVMGLECAGVTLCKFKLIYATNYHLCKFSVYLSLGVGSKVENFKVYYQLKYVFHIS
jgi:hypothetical protein